MKWLPISVVFILFFALRVEASLLDYVNTLQGTDSSFSNSHGGTLPMVGAPWPMLQWSPQTETGDFWEGGGWWFQSTAKSINGFRATRQPSPWMGDYGEFSLMPTTGDLVVTRQDRQSDYDINASTFKPDYCQIDLKKYNIQAELTAAERCAVMRFTYKTGTTGRLIVDPGRTKFKAHVELDGRTIRGYTTANNGGVPAGWKAYFVIHLDRDVTSSGTYDHKSQIHAGDKSIEGDTRVGLVVEFPTEAARTTEVRIGTSYISYQQAELNLTRETDGGFDATRARTAKAWEANLARIEVKGSEENTRTFYSCLYRAQTFPHKLYELDAANQPIHFNFYGKDNAAVPGFLYGDNGFWDVYRANYPFWAIAYPDQLGEILNGFVQAYKDSGWFPQWPSPGHRSGMIGSHIDAVIADAVVKHIQGFDVSTAYEGIRKNAFDNPPNGSVGRPDLKDYLSLGYVPAGKKNAGYCVSASLDYAYDDWCIAQVAKTLNKTDDYEQLIKRSKAYKNLWDPQTGFFRPKKKDGSWFGPFDGLAWSTGYVEGGPWQGTWAVDQDPLGMAELMGGPAAMGDKLDRMMGMPPAFHVGEFGNVIHEMTEMANVRFGQYAHSNQPVHHVLYLYTAIGQPWKTQYWTRHVCQELYNAGPTGFPGDEDNGEMSSWYILSSIGIFPACVGSPDYTLTSPLFDQVILHLPGNKQFVVRTSHNGPDTVYVRSRALDDKTYDLHTLPYDRLMQGGELKVDLGAQPVTKDGAK